MHISPPHAAHERLTGVMWPIVGLLRSVCQGEDALDLLSLLGHDLHAPNSWAPNPADRGQQTFRDKQGFMTPHLKPAGEDLLWRYHDAPNMLWLVVASAGHALLSHALFGAEQPREKQLK